MSTVDATTGHTEANRALTRGGIALFCNSALTAILGVVFWLVAAHLMGRADLGRGSALLSALLTVSALAQLNYAWALPGLLPRAGRNATRLLARVYARVVVLSIVLGLAFAIIAPLVSNEFTYLKELPGFVPLFAISVPLYSIFWLEDAVLATVRRAVIIPFENSTFGVLKIALLLALAFSHAMSISMVIIASWTLPLIFIIVPINLYLFKRGVPQAISTFPENLIKEEGTWVRYDFAGYLFWLLGTLPLPAVALIALGSVSAAAFYVPFTIVMAIDVMTINMGNQLTAEISRTQGEFRTPTILFIWRVWGAITVLSLGTIAVAPYVLDLFGAQYRSAGTTVFRVLVLAALPRSVLFLSIAAARARGAVANIKLSGPIILALQATTCILTLAISLLTMRSQGILGMAFGWTIASTIGALIALLTVRPPLLRMMGKGKGKHRTKFSQGRRILRSLNGRTETPRDSGWFRRTTSLRRTKANSEGLR